MVFSSTCYTNSFLWDNQRIIPKMKSNEQLQILSQIINFIIFIYFSIILIQANPLDILSIIISWIGLIISLIVSIIAVIERNN